MENPPFKPSWQNRFFDAIAKARLNRFMLFVLLFVVIVLVNHAFPWISHKLPFPQLDLNQLNYHIWFLFVFVAFDFFQTYSEKAIERFRPAIEVGDRDFQLLVYRFHNLPAGLGWGISIVAAVISPFAIPYFSLVATPTLTEQAIIFITMFFMFSLVAAFFVNVFRKLLLINQFYGLVEEVNLFHLEPLYAFSGLTSRTGMFFILAGVLSYLTNVVFVAGNPQVEGFIFFSSINLVLAVASFLLPLGGIHTKLVEEKERFSRENDNLILKAYRGLHEKVENGKLDDLSTRRNAISALLDYRHEIEKISTWPWQPGTLRNFVSALLLPIILWLVQGALSKLISF